MKTFQDFGIEISPSAMGPEVSAQCPACSANRKKKNSKPLSVNIVKNLWHCNHCGWSGGLDGITKAKSFAHWQSDTWRIPEYTSVKEMPSAPLKWFLSRGINLEVLRRNDIGYGMKWMPQLEAEANAIQFPFKKAGKVVNIKSRDGSKNFRQEAGCEKILFGLDDMAETTIWVEGEMDKLSLEVAGYKHCVSVPDGAPAAESRNFASKFNFMDACAAEIEKVKFHIIAVDTDAPGVALRNELVRRLGAEKCKLVTWPEDCKDANDVLVNKGVKTLQGCVETARFCQIDGVVTIKDMMPEIGRRYIMGNDEGLSMDLGGFDSLYRVRPGEMTIITGIPGSGKSEFLDQMILQLAKIHDWKFGIYSPENHPVELHAIKLVEKMADKPFWEGTGKKRLEEHDFHRLSPFINDHFFFLNKLDEELTIDDILGLCKVQVVRKGVQGLVVDPWNEVEHRRDRTYSETEYISATLSKVRRWARSNKVHVWIVAHPTKLQKDKDGKYPIPTPYDISGGAHWRNKADYCITVHRGENYGEADVHIQKVRFKEVGRLGCARFRWNPASGRYTFQVSTQQGE